MRYLEGKKCLVCEQETVYLDFSEFIKDYQDTVWAKQMMKDFGLERVEKRPRFQCDYCGSYWWDRNGWYLNE